MITSHIVNDAMSQIENDPSLTLGVKIGSQNIEPGQYIKVRGLRLFIERFAGIQ